MISYKIESGCFKEYRIAGLDHRRKSIEIQICLMIDIIAIFCTVKMRGTTEVMIGAMHQISQISAFFSILLVVFFPSSASLFSYTFSTVTYWSSLHSDTRSKYRDSPCPAPESLTGDRLTSPPLWQRYFFSVTPSPVAISRVLAPPPSSVPFLSVHESEQFILS